MKVCLQNNLLLLELILRYGGPTFTLVAAILGSGAVIFEARSGRAHALNMADSKIEAVQSKLENDITELKTKLIVEIQDLGIKVQVTQSMILETTFHTMRAIDGNKTPLRKWLGCIERCHKSGG